MRTTPLSPKTRQHLEALFAPADRSAAERALLDWWEHDSERLRFAALRESGGDLARLDAAMKDDWRDLLRRTDFGFDVHAHEIWVPRILTPQVLDTWLAGGEIEGVELRRDDQVYVLKGWALGPRGRVNALVALEPSPTYIVKVEAGSEARVRQSRLQRAE